MRSVVSALANSLGLAVKAKVSRCVVVARSWAVAVRVEIAARADCIRNAADRHLYVVGAGAVVGVGIGAVSV